jgi:1,4-dihydroxy-2-naphthoate octaprenyltransferase
MASLSILLGVVAGVTWTTLSFMLSTGHLFIFIILNPGTVVTHLMSLALVKVIWCVNSCSNWYVYGEIITGGS